MSLHYIDHLPVLGYREVDGLDLAFAWQWHTAVLRVTFTERDPALLGQIACLDGLPRLIAAPDNFDWLGYDQPVRSLAVLDHAIDLWRARAGPFRHCDN